MNIEKLSEYRAASGMTYEQIAEEAAVSLNTVSRVFTDATYNPSLATIVPIVSVIGGSLDSICGIHAPIDDGAVGFSTRDFLKTLNRLHNESLQSERRARIRCEKRAQIYFCLFLTLVALVIFFVIFDICHPQYGWVHYAAKTFETTESLFSRFNTI